MRDRAGDEGRTDRRGIRRARWPIAGLVAVIAGLAAVIAALTPFATTSASAGAPAPVRLAPAATLPPGAAVTGSVPSDATVSGEVVLKPRDPSALQSFIARASDPSSPEYHDYLAPGQFASRFGPTSATVDAVTAQLKAKGLTVTGSTDGGLLVGFRATTARVQSTFDTHLATVRLAGGAIRHATTTAVRVPASIASSVSGVVGLNSLVTLRSGSAIHGSAAQAKLRPAATAAPAFAHPSGSPAPCAKAQSAASSLGGLTDDQIANAYGAFGLYGAGDLGAGQHIAVYELESLAPSDIKTFDSCFFGAPAAAAMASRLSVHPIDGGQPAGSGSGEALLDVEDISALAPKATIDVYEAPNTDAGGLDAYARIVHADADRVISTSWGFCEQAEQDQDPGSQQAESVLFQQAAAQGQTVFAAAGDSGTEDCTRSVPAPPDVNPEAVDDPASQPYVVGVGGTTIANASSVPAQEQVWNDGTAGGAGGGGISSSWQMPAWQRGALVPGISLPGSADYAAGDRVEQASGFPTGFCQTSLGTGAACRLVPDVSAQADEFTGAITVYSASFIAAGFSSNGWTTFGGTSSAAPIWAALTADVNASSTCQANPTTSDGVGFLAPLLYGVASNPAEYSASFNDITQGDNDAYGLSDGAAYAARTGYDLASGLGSPRLTDQGGTAGLAYYLCSQAASGARPVVSGLSPASGSLAGGETVTVTGAGFESGSTNEVAWVQVGAQKVDRSEVTVTSPTSLTIVIPPAAKAIPPVSAGDDGAGNAQVVVTLSDGQSSAPTSASTFQYVDSTAGGTVPDVTLVSPFGGSRTAPAPTEILGSGFTGATRVTFGGVPVSGFLVKSPNEIYIANPPALSAATQCAPLPGSGVYAGETAANDICQVQVRVTNPSGTSAPHAIKPPPEGPIAFRDDGAIAPPGCACEIGPAPSEYDYAPTPTITSISTSDGPAELADENGGTVVTVHGTGLGYQTFDWADFGPIGDAASQDTNVSFETGTEIQIAAPAESSTTDSLTVPFSVKTLAGQSNSIGATYAGVPTISSVVNPASSRTLDGTSGGPDTGGTPLAIHGSGLAGQLVAPLLFEDQSGFSLGTQQTFTVKSDSEVDTQTIGQNPGILDVQACTVTGCSAKSGADQFILYPLGDPHVGAVQPSSGSAAGGTKATISGENLGCALDVYFGNTAAATFTPKQALLDCGSTSSLSARAPAHAAGTVPVSVETVEGYFTGAGRGTTSASFTYR